MNRKIVLYVEGGRSKSLRIGAQKAFRTFLCKVDPSIVQSLAIIAGGSGAEVGKKFERDFSMKARSKNVFLLIDSESAVATGVSSWEFVTRRTTERLEKPAGASDNHCHLMVECMENWFFADKGTIQAVLPLFRESSAPQSSHVETISKKDAMSSLSRAGYEKKSHSFKILENIDPHKVRRSSPWADRFLKSLENVVSV